MNTQKEVKAVESQYLDAITQAVQDICEKDKEKHNSSLESFEMYRSRYTLDALNEGKAHLANWRHAFEVVIDEFLQAGDKHAIQQLIQGVDTLRSHLKSKKKHQDETIAHLIGYDADLLEKMYTIGRNLFDHDRIGDAAKVFTLLVTLDPGYAACWTALGIILHAEQRFKESLDAFTMASHIDDENPITYLYTARCHKKLGQAKEAAKALKLALAYASGNQKYQAVVNSIKIEQSQI